MVGNVDNGGPAFSVVFEGGYNNGSTPHLREGMSLRDYFAAKAMQAFIQKLGETDIDIKKIPRSSYIIADAMLAERGK